MSALLSTRLKKTGCAFGLIVLIGLLFVAPAGAFDPKQEVKIKADFLEFRQESETIIGRGNVHITQGENWLKGDHIIYQIKDRKIVIHGHGSFFNGESEIQGEEIIYDSLSGQGQAQDVLSVHDPWLFRSKNLNILDQETFYAAPRTSLTTCDQQPVPHYRLEAQEILVYQEERIVARNVKIFFGRVPVLLLPSFTHALRRRNYFVSVGFDEKYGSWIKGGYAYDLNRRHYGTFLLDWWERRGLAKGVDHHFQLGETGSGNLFYYCIKEKEVVYDRDLGSYFNEVFPERVNRTKLAGNYKMSLLSPRNELRLTLDLATDPSIEYELTEKSASLILNRTSSVIVERTGKNYNLELYAEKIDNYHEQDQRYYLYQSKIPKVSFATNRLPLFNLGRSRFYHQYQFHFLNQRSWAERSLNAYHEEKDYFEQFADIAATLSNTQKITRRNTLLTSLTLREEWQDHRDINETGDVYISKLLGEVSLRSRLGQLFTNDFGAEQVRRFSEVEKTPYEDYQGIEVSRLKEKLTFREPWWQTRLTSELYYDLRNRSGTSEPYWEERLSDLVLDLETHPNKQLELLAQAVIDPYGAPNDYYSRRSYLKQNFLLKQLEFESTLWLTSLVNLEYKQKRHFLLTTGYGDWDAMEKSLVTNYAEITSQLIFPLTPKWRLTSQFEYRNNKIRKRYDLDDFKLLEEEFTLTRDLHCFEVNFTYSSSAEPNSPRRNRTIGFEFHLKALPTNSAVETQFPPKLFLFQ